MYVPVKGGAEAIAASLAALDQQRRGDRDLADIALEQIINQFSLGVDRIMSEAGLYDPRLAALAFKQAQGDLAEAVFLLRAHRAQLPDFGEAIFCDLDALTLERDISATQKELAGGQVLGATYDYSHRLLDFSLEAGRDPAPVPVARVLPPSADQDESVTDLLQLEPAQIPVDITRQPLAATPSPAERLGHLARGEEGYMTGIAYESLRTAGQSHPYVSRLKRGELVLDVTLEDIGLQVSIGTLRLTTCSLIEADDDCLHEGFGIAFGAAERRALAMAAVDLQLKRQPASADSLMHCDGVAASGYLSHLKLPHYSDFAADLDRLKGARE